MTHLTKERLEEAKEWFEHKHRGTTIYDGHPYQTIFDLIDAKTAPTWQPIETAPKDVLVDLLWEGKRFVDCNWDHICQEWRHMTHFNQLIFIKNPEYWMPLPTPPEKSE